jgi:ribosome-associated protein YbcJ (S4-like RNA binding protein)
MYLEDFVSSAFKVQIAAVRTFICMGQVKVNGEVANECWPMITVDNGDLVEFKGQTHCVSSNL